MEKRECINCGKELGFLSFKTNIADATVCRNCLHEAGIGSLANPQSISGQQLVKTLELRKELVSSFKATKSIGTYLELDEKNQAFRVKADIFEYKNLLSFELLEDREAIAKGGLGRALAGGLLFGGVGAVVGGVTGGKKTRSLCNSMQIRLTLKNAHLTTSYINFISSETKTKSHTYRSAQRWAQECISALQLIVESNQEASEIPAFNGSPADEILKFKQLYDAGIITADEYQAKKQELLGLD